jgi:hypothetical protein
VFLGVACSVVSKVVSVSPELGLETRCPKQ